MPWRVPEAARDSPRFPEMTSCRRRARGSSFEEGDAPLVHDMSATCPRPFPDTSRRWKSIGKGMLRLLAQERGPPPRARPAETRPRHVPDTSPQEGVHFLEFRPLVSESSSAANDEPSDEVGAKREKYGRAVLSARLLSSTTFTVAKRSIQTNLWSSNAGGEATYSRYNIPLLSDEQANAFAELARGCVPKE